MYKPLILSRSNRKQALEAVCDSLNRQKELGFTPVYMQAAYTPAFEGGQRQQYIWEVILEGSALNLTSMGESSGVDTGGAISPEGEAAPSASE